MAACCSAKHLTFLSESPDADPYVPFEEARAAEKGPDWKANHHCPERVTGTG